MNSSLMLSYWGRRVAKKLMNPQFKLKKQPVTNRWNIVRGDMVQVIQGPQTGQKGKVLKVLRESNRLIIDGVNMRSRNVKPLMDGTPGKKVMKPCSVHYSNAMLIDPTNGEPTKIVRRYLEDGTKVRVSKKTGTIIPKPDFDFMRKPRSAVVGPKDTDPADVFKVTFPDYEKYLPHIYETIRREN